MKTLTELSGSQVRAAAAAIDEAKRSLPAEQPPQPAAAPAAPEGGEAPGEQQDAAPAAEQQDAAPAAEQPVEAEAQAEAEAEAAPVVPVAAAAPAAVLEAVGKATGVSGDRLAMLCAAVEAAGGRLQDVRLVRVFGPEEPVPGAKRVGGHQYVVDLMPASMKQVAESSREEGRRGGRGRGGGRGGGGGGRGGEKTGGFSMDSLREDRKNQRGGPGRFGGGRKPGGGGRPPGGAPRGR
jgi:hypothetical protein